MVVVVILCIVGFVVYKKQQEAARKRFFWVMTKACCLLYNYAAYTIQNMLYTLHLLTGLMKRQAGNGQYFNSPPFLCVDIFVRNLLRWSPYIYLKWEVAPKSEVKKAIRIMLYVYKQMTCFAIWNLKLDKPYMDENYVFQTSGLFAFTGTSNFLGVSWYCWVWG